MAVDSRIRPRHPPTLWRNPEPKRHYDVVVGAGGHGLATAYYLARNHGLGDVAVLECGWSADANMARNTTSIRSNYNPYGRFAERWVHPNGCGRWFSADRDTTTNEMIPDLPHSRQGRR